MSMIDLKLQILRFYIFHLLYDWMTVKLAIFIFYIHAYQKPSFIYL